MKVSVMDFETPAACKAMAVKFNVFVANLFESQGYEMCERIVWPKGTRLFIDRGYLHNWTAFKSQGYKIS